MPARHMTDMDKSKARIFRWLLPLAGLLAILVSAAPFVAQAATAAKPGPPKVSTGTATAVRGTSATLRGTVDPNGAATTYYFRYGPTITYGKQTIAAKIPAGVKGVKVGQAVTGLLAGYHYRLVASNEHGPGEGKDRIFAVKRTSKGKFTLVKPTEPTVFGGTYVLSGTLSGTGSANRALVLQASPYPFLQAFTTVGVATHTDAAGRFSFHVANLTRTTQFRVSTLDPRPLYSPVITQIAAAKVILKVRSSGHPGLVRLYGTVTPAKPGAHLNFQLFKAVRPGNSAKTEERTGRFATQFTTIVRRGTATVSRFSAIVKIVRGGSYRAYVNLSNRAAIGAGWSRSVLLHAAPASPKRH